MGERNAREKTIGRIILIVFYLIFCALYATLILTPTPYPSGVASEGLKTQLVGSIIVTMVWTTVLFGALFFNQGWARYVYLVLLGLSVMFTIPLYFGVTLEKFTIPLVMWVIAVFNVIVFVTMIASKSLRKLGQK